MFANKESEQSEVRQLIGKYPHESGDSRELRICFQTCFS